MLLSCCPEFYACLLIIIRCRLSQAHANVFPHHIFGPEPIDDQINFDPSRPIQNGMFSLKGKRALFLCCCLQRAYFPVFRAARWLRKSSARRLLSQWCIWWLIACNWFSLRSRHARYLRASLSIFSCFNMKCSARQKLIYLLARSFSALFLSLKFFEIPACTFVRVRSHLYKKGRP
jgi:hypothetical protein